jgi:L-threonylcarbamoyladenylate synthase
VTGATGRVGVRVPADEIARSLCRAAGVVLTATSANVSGEPASSDPDEVERALARSIDLLVDGGPTRGGAPSTIVDVTGAPFLVRGGAVSWEAIQRCLEQA